MGARVSSGLSINAVYAWALVMRCRIKKILHVSEALGTGVLNLISQLAIAQARDGFEVVLLYSIRPETPSEDQLAILFPHPIVRINLPMVARVSPLRDLFSIFKLMKLITEIRPAAIHLHSSKAGILGRIAASLVGYRPSVFYSPHGLSFLKQDVSAGKRLMYLWFERMAVHLGGVFIASSASEADLARQTVKHKRVVLVENSIALEYIQAHKEEVRSKVRVVTVGRICYAKAPWRLRDLAVQLSNESAEFIWIGDGELRHELYAGGKLPENLSISGWRGRGEVYGDLSCADVFVLLSLWEGMPLSLIEAQASGLPAVVSNVGGCKDVVIHGETGFVCGSMEEIVDKVRLLIQDNILRAKMGKKARKMAGDRFSIERMHQEMLAVYGFISQDSSDRKYEYEIF